MITLKSEGIRVNLFEETPYMMFFDDLPNEKSVSITCYNGCVAFLFQIPDQFGNSWIWLGWSDHLCDLIFRDALFIHCIECLTYKQGHTSCTNLFQSIFLNLYSSLGGNLPFSNSWYIIVSVLQLVIVKSKSKTNRRLGILFIFFVELNNSIWFSKITQI